MQTKWTDISRFKYFYNITLYSWFDKFRRSNDYQETNEDEGHGSESLIQDSNSESSDGGKLKRLRVIQQREKLEQIQKIIQQKKY